MKTLFGNSRMQIYKLCFSCFVVAAFAFAFVILSQPRAQLAPNPEENYFEKSLIGSICRLAVPVAHLQTLNLSEATTVEADFGVSIGTFGSTEGVKLKKEVQNAMIRSIDIDIQLYTTRLNLVLGQGTRQEEVTVLQQALAALNQERQYVSQLSPSMMKSPEQRRLTIKTNTPYNYGSVLNPASKKNNPPLYYIAGIAGDDFSVLEHRGQQSVTVYVLRRRSYKEHATEPDGYYVYIAIPGEAGPGFSSPDHE